ncbi:hypothetical protein [Mycobacterium sp. BK086]|uniref:hypothetical protein n=1 Tax=Mycobacterium sp. BK086 TaxID=2512165 RepID=UPI0014151F3C|nr:hypothetical protein [Mycobacterium sp. BK086]
MAAIIAIIINLTQHDTSRSTASVTATTTASKTSAPERSSSTTVSSTASTGGVVTVTVQPQQAVGVVVGTCDEGGTCGVKQRDAPYAAAPRLYPDDLRDGIRVTLICQTIGDSRTSAGHGTSTVWYRLDNGAYVNSVYLAVTAGPVPMC